MPFIIVGVIYRLSKFDFLLLSKLLTTPIKLIRAQVFEELEDLPTKIDEDQDQENQDLDNQDLENLEFSENFYKSFVK